MRDREQELITRKEAANLIAKRLPIDMLKPYDTDCFASMLRLPDHCNGLSGPVRLRGWGYE